MSSYDYHLDHSVRLDTTDMADLNIAQSDMTEVDYAGQLQIEQAYEYMYDQAAYQQMADDDLKHGFWKFMVIVGLVASVLLPIISLFSINPEMGNWVYVRSILWSLPGGGLGVFSAYMWENVGVGHE